ncbi:hypothetical protein VULLAG_LOCUS11393 [Vulpes lagopus]
MSLGLYLQSCTQEIFEELVCSFNYSGSLDKCQVHQVPAALRSLDFIQEGRFKLRETEGPATHLTAHSPPSPSL